MSKMSINGSVVDIVIPPITEQRGDAYPEGTIVYRWFIDLHKKWSQISVSWQPKHGEFAFWQWEVLTKSAVSETIDHAFDKPCPMFPDVIREHLDELREKAQKELVHGWMNRTDGLSPFEPLMTPPH